MAKAKKSILPSSEKVEAPEWLWIHDGFAERCPSLYELLARGFVDDEARKGGSITIFVSAGKLKVCFCDRQTQNLFYGLLAPGDDLWLELEALVAGEHEAWQSTRKSGGAQPF